jgi:hypothetical protein
MLRSITISESQHSNLPSKRKFDKTYYQISPAGGGFFKWQSLLPCVLLTSTVT